MSTPKKAQGRDLTIIRENRPTFVQEQREDIQETASVLLAEGKTLQQVADYIGIAFNTLTHLRRKYPAFRDELERAAFEGSTAILEQMRDIPFNEPEAARARVKIDALCRYLELRWPSRFGKRVDVTVKTLDMGDALAKARERAGNVYESTAYVIAATDDVSVADGIDDLF